MFLKTDAFDLIVTDIHLSDGHAAQLLEVIHQLAKHPKVILMTGTLEVNIVDSLVKKILHKPFNLSDMIETIRTNI